jgi:hypothetical protein
MKLYPLRAGSCSSLTLCPFALSLGLAALLWGVGWQSAWSGDSTPAQTPSPQATLATKPRPVVVRDFVFDDANLHVDQGKLASREGPAKRVLGGRRSEEAPAQKAARLANLLSETIVNSLGCFDRT